ncbi:MAG: hypothetical protein NT023_24995 [Armatimonadetes bacterium]|nr:hypothetical protein [Armatimonadota bacterium]
MAISVDELAQTVIRILETRFEGAKADITPMPNSGRVSGEIVWDGFEGIEPIDRQKMVRTELNSMLGILATYVSLILTFTSQEIEEILAA